MLLEWNVVICYIVICWVYTNLESKCSVNLFDLVYADAPLIVVSVEQ